MKARAKLRHQSAAVQVPIGLEEEFEGLVDRSKIDDSIIVQDAILAFMEPNVQKRFENWGPYEITQEQKGMFRIQARTERYGISKFLFVCKMVK